METLRDKARDHGCSIFSLVYSAMNIGLLRINPPTEERLQRDISNPISIAPINVRHQTEGEDASDRTKWGVRMSLGLGQFNAGDLGRFVNRGQGGGDESDESQGILAANVWTLAKDIAQQLTENRRNNERIAVYMDDIMPAIMATELENLGSDLG